MSASDPPTQLPPIDVEVYDIQIQEDNAIWLRLRFGDGTYVGLEFPPDSPLSHDLLELLGRAASDKLRRLGQRGIRVMGFTPPQHSEGEQ